ncbi:hypothetical protein A3E65_01670 [Candidatus Kaiserbacteria bacterium RIFCSPHIGHO2_12_FULL_56_13]|uniref:Type II secretion system protein GspI C-terminal domain-containing protein n=2 Tax=Candidatus Kaiseribacteriota TaxID=1752734 RepID=A0A1F6E665_9BACT|nr:MAG: hypothetical protein A3C95_00790 [Candidatus Kaiserbacteria bacterium RIFCSPHIGHO2_02_FULL_56_30]OGG72389.1 MAG: hypothetical protein A3E65_01670 [Candidatus Kaiserbacteria bacterium RIFCSPHIGHO2_12_FULL_56_13]
MRGFSYIELIVTLALVGVILTVFLALLSPLPLARVAEHRSIALAVAENELDALRAAGYGVLPESGSWSAPELALLPSGAGTRTVTDYNDTTKQVVVNVTWSEIESTTPYSITLSTLITIVGGIP